MSGHQAFDNFGNGFFVISLFGAFMDVLQELLFFSGYLQTFQGIYHEESQG